MGRMGMIGVTEAGTDPVFVRAQLIFGPRKGFLSESNTKALQRAKVASVFRYSLPATGLIFLGHQPSLSRSASYLRARAPLANQRCCPCSPSVSQKTSYISGASCEQEHGDDRVPAYTNLHAQLIVCLLQSRIRFFIQTQKPPLCKLQASSCRPSPNHRRPISTLQERQHCGCGCDSESANQFSIKSYWANRFTVQGTSVSRSCLRGWSLSLVHSTEFACATCSSV